MLKTTLIAVSALMTVIFGLVLFGFSYELYLRYYDSGTEYTPQFSRDYFNQLKKNTPVSEVLSNIGPPFWKNGNRDGEDWYYSRGAEGKGHNEVVAIVVNTNLGTVIRTWSGYMD